MRSKPYGVPALLLAPTWRCAYVCRLARWSSVPALTIAAGLIACSPADRREIRERAVTAGAKAEATLEDAALTTAIKSKLLADQTVSA